MKRIIVAFAILAMVGSGFVYAGGQAEEDTDDLRVVLYLNGTLGDQSFFDSAARGVQMAEDQFGLTTQIIEGGYDPANWEPDLQQIAEGNWDIFIAGTAQLIDYIADIAPMYPDTTFFHYDQSVDYGAADLSNVYSILYAQNEGSFLVGAIAGMLTQAELERSNPDTNTIGFIGGMDIPIINDFLAGYRQGAEEVNPDVDVLVSYVGNFDDPARGKELALAQIEQGADVIFPAAGESGLGALEAAGEQGVYSIGVDSDQYELLIDEQPEIAEAIVTSMLKNVDNSIVRAVQMYLDGDLPVGQAEVLGIPEEGVGLARNENFDRIVTDEMVRQLDRLIDAIDAGEIQVDTAL